VQDKCRCADCREACRVYEQARRRKALYGRWQPYVPADEARAHVRSLQAAGMGWKRIARAAGLSPSVLWKLLYGDRTRNLAPSKRIRPATAAALLAVEPDLAPGAYIDAGPTWRRIEGLVALGYSKRWLAHQLGAQRATACRSGPARCRYGPRRLSRRSLTASVTPLPRRRRRRRGPGTTPRARLADAGAAVGAGVRRRRRAASDGFAGDRGERPLADRGRAERRASRQPARCEPGLPPRRSERQEGRGMRFISKKEEQHELSSRWLHEIAEWEPPRFRRRKPPPPTRRPARSHRPRG
jgi:hypothetical protein